MDTTCGCENGNMIDPFVSGLASSFLAQSLGYHSVADNNNSSNSIKHSKTISNNIKELRRLKRRSVNEVRNALRGDTVQKKRLCWIITRGVLKPTMQEGCPGNCVVHRNYLKKFQNQNKNHGMMQSLKPILENYLLEIREEASVSKNKETGAGPRLIRPSRYPNQSEIAQVIKKFESCDIEDNMAS